ncbi:oxidative stress survival Svf1-like protein [Lactifluus volemus]|nr:oxidative stress survival Svf1-like protein [Lactifluus volemus]
MFSSLFSSAPAVDPHAPNFLPVSDLFSSGELYGELEPSDIEWKCASGFVAETQTWYTILPDGSYVMCQVIHSSIGLWYPTIQFTFKTFNPETGEKTWRSVNVSNFVTPPPNLDKRSSQADEFTITHNDAPGEDYPESYTISVNLAKEIGKGPDGGYSYFGPDAERPEGYVVHRFWPLTKTSGTITLNGKPLDIEGPGCSPAHGGVSAVQMEFTTTNGHGRRGAGSGYVSVNVGGLVIGGKLAAVTAETKWPDQDQPATAEVVSRAQHLKQVLDRDTDYMQPTELSFRWVGPSVLPDKPGSIEGIDFLAEVPAVVKAVVSYVAGTKPYIYQWINPAKLVLTGPELILPGLAEGLEVEGFSYSEATFISK